MGFDHSNSSVCRIILPKHTSTNHSCPPAPGPDSSVTQPSIVDWGQLPFTDADLEKYVQTRDIASTKLYTSDNNKDR